MTAHVIGLTGATGGLGVSTLAAATAHLGGASGLHTVAVDSSRWGVGLAVGLAMEGQPGLRWEDLLATDGDLPGAELLAALPRVGQVGLLCREPAGAAAWARVPRSVEHHARRALAQEAELVVVDLPPLGSGDFLGWASACHEVHVLVGGGLGPVAVAPALGEGLRSVLGRTGVVVRGRQVGARVVEAVEAASGHPVSAVLPDDPAVSRCEERGEPVGSRPGPVRDLAQQLLTGAVEVAA
ncbi:Cellulose biosynthesis protein BcsQ [Kytococcus aerolatus]|uniref:Cellulose biosynthesis protein BcsQ n=1 Tax=Kytococcus aerolatus TaxID=592308 RepID=A0A212U6C2_9MICO|nr:hypothetical protein [Kytococcus aerolatus]SNC73815.1 Cellulose biosynthesis protein BcsQ [Kytococcus aerolatus]